MSRKIKERTKQLAEKEAEIKNKLLGRSTDLKSKANQVGKVAIIGGIAAFVIYMVYRSFSDGEEKPKKTKYVKTGSSVVAEKLTTFLLPYLGQFLDRILNDKLTDKSKKEEKEDS